MTYPKDAKIQAPFPLENARGKKASVGYITLYGEISSPSWGMKAPRRSPIKSFLMAISYSIDLFKYLFIRDIAKERQRMREELKTKEQVMKELHELRRRIIELEAVEIQGKRAEEALRENEKLFKELWDNAPVAYHTLDTKGHITRVNQTEAKMLGYIKEEMVGKSIFDFILSGQRAEAQKRFQQKISGQSMPKAEGRIYLKKDGSRIYVDIDDVVERDSDGKIIGVRTTMVDITERKRAEEQAKQLKEYLALQIARMPIGLITWDTEFRVQSWNPASERIFGFTPEEALRKHPYDLIVPKEAQSQVDEIWGRLLEGDTTAHIINDNITKDGRTIICAWTNTPLKRADGTVVGVLSMVQDITEQKRAERALRESEELFRSIVENSYGGILIVDDAFKIVYCNDELCRILEYHPEEIIGQDFRKFLTDESKVLVADHYIRRQSGEQVPSRYEFSIVRKNGEKRIVEISSAVIKDSAQKVETVAQILDITARKRGEKIKDSIYKISEAAHSAQNLEELFGSIHRIIEELMPAKNSYIALYDYDSELLSFPYFVDEYDEAPAPQKLGKGLTEYVLRTGEPLLASPEVFDDLVKKGEVESIGAPSIDWLGVPLKTEDKTIGVLVVQTYTEGVRFGEEDKDILRFVSDQAAMAINRKRTEQELRESEKRYRELFDHVPIGLYRTTPGGKTLDANPALLRMLGYPDRESMLEANTVAYYANPEDRERWKTALEKNGVLEDFESQLRRQDGRIIWVKDGARAIKNKEGCVLYYEGALVDFTERKKAEEELNYTLEMLRKSLGATIQAISTLVEMRDPYTAGHQRRVADLGRAIAKEMGLSQLQVDGIRMAGLIHDIGKISIPAEILSKPGRLGETEFNMLKIHPQYGYDILKQVEFPGPVAQAVFQHHERIDGSGYPLGLKDKEILIEAKVLAVADVVEAMISHRPYRAAHSLQSALKEISNNSGVLYDPKVVEACLRLFVEKGFTFREEGKATISPN